MSNGNVNQKNSLVVDLDDTLCFTFNRDFENATPNLELIKKLNFLFEKGWEIHIVTARGQLSCDGDSQKADKKYRPQVISYLQKHGVKFNTLSFQKKLARYYIDDKSITPEHFLSLKFDVIGRSGAQIISDSEFIYKMYPTYESAQEFIRWSIEALARVQGVNIPRLVSIIGNEIKMEKIGFTEARISDIKHILELNQKFRNISPTFIQSSIRYVNNLLVNHIDKLTDDWAYFGERYKNLVDSLSPDSIEEIRHTLQKHKSFNHGDFSIDNILVQNNRQRKIFLIDPIYGEHKFQSYLLDLAKFHWSCFISERYYSCAEIETYIKKNVDIDLDQFRRLSVCEGIRTVRYSQTEDEKQFKLGRLNDLCEQDWKFPN